MGRLHRVTARTVGGLGKLKPPDGDTLVTVVTPTIGRAAIARAILSVNRQTHRRIEHVIVADGPRAAACCPVNPTATLGRNWSTPRTGPGAYATNVGWLLAHGEYLYTLPDDDWLEDDCIERFVAGIGEHDFAWSQVEFSKPSTTPAACLGGKTQASWISGHAGMADGNHATPDQFFHRRLLEFGTYFASGTWSAEQPGQDVDLLSAWLRAGASGVFVPGILAHHEVNH